MAEKYVIGNAHLDPVWLWRWQEGYTEVLCTFRSMLDRLREFPHTKFTSACSVYYQWIEKTDPAMFAEIQQMVKEGRWNIIGGWYLQPDCNIPDGESFLRHMLIAQRYFKEKFGITVKTGYNVDSFGHNAGLPKLLKAGGIENYVFMRPSTKEQGREERLFQWESDDGSRVLAYRIPHYYNITLERLGLLDQLAKEADETGDDVMIFCGIGNHGGGPSIRLLDAIDRRKLDGLVHAGPDEYFRCVDKTNLPVIAGELQHHARGCYSAETFIKRMNRKCEQNLLAAEIFSTMAAKLTGAAYPAEELRKAWHNVLFNQFHDILCGCAVKSAYEDAGYQLGETMSITEKAINHALQRLAWNIDTLQGEALPAYKAVDHCTVWEHEVLGTPVVLFNAHPWPVRQCVRINVVASMMTDPQGREIPFQIVRSDNTNLDNKYHTLFMAEVPAMGYTVYRLFTKKKGGAAFENRIAVTQTTLENDRIRVELDSVTGDICRIRDKLTGMDILNHTCKAVLLDETGCDTWAHDKFILGETVDTFTACRFEIVEQGNVCGSIRTTARCGSSVLERTYSILPGSDEVRVHVRVDFHEKHRALKLTFPLTDETVTAKIPCGTVQRKGYTGEEPCGSWFASGSLCVANDSKYAYDTQDGEVRMTVLRSAIYADHFGEEDSFCDFMEQGLHEFTYSLFPNRSSSECERRASELNFGLRYVFGGFHGGKLPEQMACVENPQDNVIISAVKAQEDGNGTVIRLYEMEGKDSAVCLRLFDMEITAQLSAYGLQTLDESGRALNAMEWTL